MLRIFVFYLISCLSVIRAGTVYMPATKTPPESRGGIATAYIPSKDIIIVFGGLSRETYYDDFWSFNIKSLIWQEIYPISEINPCNL